MKTISISTALAVVAALFVLPVSFSAGVSLVFLVGLAGIAITDYTRLSPSDYSTQNSLASITMPMGSLSRSLELAA